VCMLRPAGTLLPEKRKVDSSILSLTTSTGHTCKALTSDNVSHDHGLLEQPYDPGCPFVTVLRRAMLHAGCT
jgi:hypothetical protein